MPGRRAMHLPVWARRILWFCALWLASVVALGIVAAVIRAWLL